LDMGERLEFGDFLKGLPKLDSSGFDFSKLDDSFAGDDVSDSPIPPMDSGRMKVPEGFSISLDGLFKNFADKSPAIEEGTYDYIVNGGGVLD